MIPFVMCNYSMYRWLLQGQQDRYSDAESLEDIYGISSIIASQIIPAELNTILYRYENHLSTMADALGETDDAMMYQEAAEDRKYAINALMWNASAMR